MNILITGGMGYLGQVLANKLARKHNVILYDNLIYGQTRPEHKLIRGDVGDYQALLNAMTENKIDAVIALAAIVGDEACRVNPELTHQTNIIGTQNTVLACKEAGVKKLVFASTCSVYGTASGVVNESNIVNPLSDYAKSRYESEKIILNTAENLEYVILRFGTLYGASRRMRFDLVLNRMTGDATNNGKITVNGGNQWRPLTNINDAARAIEFALKLDSFKKIFNVVGGNYRIKEIAFFVHNSCPKAIIENKPELTDPRDYNVSSEAIESHGFKTIYNLRDGVMDVKQKLKKIKDHTEEQYSNEKWLLKNAMTR